MSGPTSIGRRPASATIRLTVYIPVAGHVDDLLAVVLTLRVVLRASGGERLRKHWPGPESSLTFVLRFVGLPAAAER